MSLKYFVAMCVGGIGNRLLGLFDAIIEYEKHYSDREFIIYWPCLPNINKNKFIKLINDEIKEIGLGNRELFSFDDQKNSLNLLHLYYCSTFNCSFDKLFNMNYPYIYHINLQFVNNINSNQIELFKYKNNIINTNKKYLFFISNGSKLSKNLNLIVNIIRKLKLKFNTILSNITDIPSKGLHIRYTDRTNIDDVDTKVKYIEKNFKTILKDKIYVCCDEKEIIDILKEKYNIFTINTTSYVEKFDEKSDWISHPLKNIIKYKYNIFRSEESCIDSIKELYLLSKCNATSNLKKSTFYIISRGFYKAYYE